MLPALWKMYCINENIQIKTNLYLFYAAHEMFTKETIIFSLLSCGSPIQQLSNHNSCIKRNLRKNMKYTANIIKKFLKSLLKGE